jgi:hypothetical protein
VAGPDRSIFRERAIEKHIHRREPQILLRVASPPVFRFLWILLVLFAGVGALVWSIRVPITISGTGLALRQKAAATPAAHKILLLLILPSDGLDMLQKGQSVRFCAGSTGNCLNGTLDEVEAHVMSPDAIRTQFKVPSAVAQVIAGPSAVAFTYATASQASVYLGSQGHVEVQIGSQSPLSLLPGPGGLFKN